MRTNLKLLRVKHGLTQKEMAERIGCTRVTYAVIETGTRNGRRDFWESVQNAFGVPDAEMWLLQKQDNE